MKIKTIIITALLFTGLSLHAQTERKATDFVSKYPGKTFLGAVLEYKSINTEEYKFVKVEPSPVTISFSLPVKSETIIPSYENLMNVVRDKVVRIGKIKSNHSFSFSLKELKSYDFLSLSFGQKIDTDLFFGISKDAKPRKTAVMVDMSQTYFSVDMDLPESGKIYDKNRNLEIVKREDELVYIGSVEFGRKVTVIVESPVSYGDLKQAIQEALSESKDKPMSKKSRSILARATVRVMVIGDEKLPDTHPDNVFGNIKDYFDRPVTVEDFGKPITFQASYVKDNSAFQNTF